MSLNVPYKIRAALYILNAIGGPIVAYLLAKEIIGELELTLWAAESAAVFALAGLNVTPNEEEIING